MAFVRMIRSLWAFADAGTPIGLSTKFDRLIISLIVPLSINPIVPLLIDPIALLSITPITDFNQILSGDDSDRTLNHE